MNRATILHTVAVGAMGLTLSLPLAGCGGNGGINLNPFAKKRPVKLNDGSTPKSYATGEEEASLGSDMERMISDTERDLQEFMAASNAAQDTEDTAVQPKVVFNDGGGRSTTPATTTPAAADNAAPGATGQPPLFSTESQLDPPPNTPVSITPPETAVESGGTDGARAQLDIDDLIVRLSGALYRDAVYDDVPLRQLLLIAALTMEDPGRAISPDAIPGLTEREREILGEFQRFFQSLGSDLNGRKDVEEVVTEALQSLQTSLVEQPILTIASSLLCTRVGGFGDFDEFSHDVDGPCRFLAHAEQQAIVYLEIDDFTSRLSKQGEWVTELSQQLVIYSDRDGIPVWKKTWEPAIDKTRNQRQDFFTVQVITLPKALSVGRYHLKIQVRDENSSAETEATITFEMVADANLVSR